MGRKGVRLAVLGVLFLSLFSHFVLADFEASVAADGTPSIRPDEQAVFRLTIVNNGDMVDTFRLRLENVEWNVLSSPLYDYFGGMDIPAGSSKTTTLLLSPAEPLPVGSHRVQLRVESATGIVRRVEMLVQLKSPIPSIRDYLATVGRIVQISPQLNPSNPALVLINLENRNPKNISALGIKLQSNLINQETVVALGPLEKKIVRLTAELDPRTQPQQDLLSVTFTAEGQPLSPAIRESYEIIGYSNIKETKLPETTGFLAKTQETAFFNDGNVVGQKTYEQESNILREIFTRSEPDSFRVSRNGRSYLSWSLSIPPGETATVTVTESYVPLFVVLVILGIIALGYYITRSPVVIRKESTIVGLSEGGISEVKVVLHVKNRVSGNFKDVRINDRVPHIAQVIKEFEVGTLNPTKVFKHSREGTVLLWHIDRLEKFEERIISYTIKSKLSIIGGFRLPRAVMKFKDKKGKERATRSNVQSVVHRV